MRLLAMCAGPRPRAQVDGEELGDVLGILLGVVGAHDQRAGHHRAAILPVHEHLGAGLFFQRVGVRRPDADQLSRIRRQAEMISRLSHVRRGARRLCSDPTSRGRLHGVVAGRVGGEQDCLPFIELPGPSCIASALSPRTISALPFDSSLVTPMVSRLKRAAPSTAGTEPVPPTSHDFDAAAAICGAPAGKMVNSARAQLPPTSLFRVAM